MLKDREGMIKNEIEDYSIISEPIVTMLHPVIDIDITEYASSILLVGVRPELVSNHYLLLSLAWVEARPERLLKYNAS